MARRVRDPQTNIIVVLDNSLFDTKVSIFDKERGLTVAQKLEGKIKRKTGSSQVLSLMDAQSKTWMRKLTPAPRPNMIYVRHPYDAERYLGAKQFHDVIMVEKREELFQVLIALGAKSITWGEMGEWSRNYEKPTDIAPTLGDLEDSAVFLPRNPQWTHLVQDRLLTWCAHGHVNFVYEDDYGLNDSIIDKILEKIDAHPECLTDYETEMHDTVKKGFIPSASDRIVQLNEKYKSFKPLRDVVSIEFFSVDEYKENNLLRIRRNWGVDHVEGHLRHALLERLVPMFRVENITGVMLLKIPDMEPGGVMKRFFMSSRELELLKLSLDDIGDVDSVDLMLQIEDSAPAIAEAHCKRKPGEMEDVVAIYQQQVDDALKKETVARARAEVERARAREDAAAAQAEAEAQERADRLLAQRAREQELQRREEEIAQQIQQDWLESQARMAADRARMAEERRAADEAAAQAALERQLEASADALRFAQEQEAAEAALSQMSRTSRSNASNDCHTSMMMSASELDGHATEADEYNVHNSQDQNSYEPSMSAQSTVPPAMEALYGAGDYPIVGRFDVVVIGGGAVGKTSLFKSFSDRQVDPNEPTTIGQLELQHAVGNATIHYVDVAGSDIDASAIARMIHSADCVMFLYDITSQDSFDWLGSLVPDVIMADHSTWLSMAFVGNKVDLCLENPAARQVTAAAAREFADAVGVELALEVSALTGQGVGVAFAELLHSADEMRFSAPPKTSRGILPPLPWPAAGAASAALDKEAYHQGFAPRKEEVCDSCSVQ